MRLVVFDMDGTLIDSVALIAETMTAAFVAVGETAPGEAAIRSISGITARDAMAILAPDADAARVDRITASYRNEYAGRAGGAREPLFAGALAALERSRHCPLSLAQGSRTGATVAAKGGRGAGALG